MRRMRWHVWSLVCVWGCTSQMGPSRTFDPASPDSSAPDAGAPDTSVPDAMTAPDGADASMTDTAPDAQDASTDARDADAEGGVEPGPSEPTVCPLPSVASGHFVAAWDDENAGRVPAIAIHDPETGIVSSLVLGTTGCCEYGLTIGPIGELAVVNIGSDDEVWLTRVDTAARPWSVKTNTNVLVGAPDIGARPERPQVAWTGSGYVVGFLSPDGVYTMKVGADGEALGTLSRVITATPGYELQMASAGDGKVGLAYQGSGVHFSAHFAILDSDGALVHGPTRVDDTWAFQVRMVPLASSYAVSYVDSSGIHLGVLDSEAALLSDTLIASACQSSCPSSSRLLYGGSSITTDGCDVILLYTDAREPLRHEGLYLSRVKEDGEIVGSEQTVAEGVPLYVSWPTVGWDRAANAYGVAYNDVATRGVVFTRVDDTGVVFEMANGGGQHGIRRHSRMLFVPEL